ncbi:transglycosylase domain-containing protein [Marinicella sp. W31]|uniref:transglycosylase domain-containing protein n=1 Tax=Marinicella sp. W31 TaxID=3023713 RepID=UPI003757C4D6
MRLLLWFTPGLVVGLMVPWMWYLNHVVESIVAEEWDIPSSIYARPLELYKGRYLLPEALEYELNALGYQKTDQYPNIGQYRKQNQLFEVYTKGFQFSDKTTQPQRIKMTLVDRRVQEINHSIIRLEPLVIGRFYSSNWENRQPIGLQDVPVTLVKGVQAVEDRKFKHHRGIDVIGIVRALIKNIFAGRIVQGGSSITQQLVKNKLEYPERSWLRKINEAVSAVMLENKADKKTILQMYFNEIYWGQNGKVAIHGIVQAAQYYFAKPVGQLTLEEQALLVGIIKGPSWYNPFKHPKRAVQRRNLVLKMWFDTGIVNKREYQQSVQKPLWLSSQLGKKQQYQDFIDLVKHQLIQQFSEQQLNQSGLRIFSTLDPFVQLRANQSAGQTDNLLGNEYETALVISDIKNGEILAINGSKTEYSFYNRALLAKRQIGSLIKPFLFLAALEILSDFDLKQNLNDAPTSITTDDGNVWKPRNWDGKSLGRIRAEQALILSRNQATVDLGQRLGVKDFLQFLKHIGLQLNRGTHPSVLLGAIELSPLEVNNLYHLFAARDRSQGLSSIRSITDQKGTTIRRTSHVVRHQLTSGHIESIKSLLQRVTQEGTAKKLTGVYGFRQPLFGKTGTTNEGRDSWFVGFNTEYLATVWVGRDDNKPTPLSGSSGALLLWAQLFKNL